jgi:hypothetical protein
MAVNIEDAGFEIRDMIAWIYGSGFPKSLSIGKAVDKLQGNERIKTGEIKHHAQKGVAVAEERGAIGGGAFGQAKDEELTKGTSEWEGWGTALKPSVEPLTVARKPLEKGLTVAENCLKWGVGGINIDESRVATDENLNGGMYSGEGLAKTIADHKWRFRKRDGQYKQPAGRWPANLIHDGSQEVLDLFPNTGNGVGQRTYDDSGSASRFFYCAKASKAERNRGCEGLEEKFKAGTEFRPSYLERYEETGDNGTPSARFGKMTNNHPTVKPIALMEYLVKLVTREGQTVLDPFAGSGTTGIACKNLNREAILIEREAEYVEIAKRRIAVNQ